MRQYRKYTEAQFIEAVRTSTSKRQVLIKLGLAPQGGNYATVTRLIQQLSLDTSHFLGQGHAKGKRFDCRVKPIEDYLSGKRDIKSYKLKKRLLDDGLFQHRCCRCRRTTWMKQPIPLELHHIDGNSSNNQLHNLELLCPNCHAQTPNYRGRGI